MTRYYRVGGRRFEALPTLWAAIVANAVLLGNAVYFLAGPDSLRGITPVVVPVVWLGVGVWAISATERPTGTARQRAVAGGLAVGYFLVLGYFGGLWSGGLNVAASARLEVLGLPPGWAPALLVTNEWIQFALFPFKVVGYLALAYLVYAAALDAAGSAITGLVGLLSCVSCTWPVLAAVATGVLGSGTGLATAALDQSYLLSTVVFVVTVALLHWRPGWR